VNDLRIRGITPHDARKAFWTTFLGRETAVMYGSEKIAKEHNHVVVFGHIRKIARGKYEMWFELISDEPQETAYGEITLRHTRILEKDILQQPEYWLWTHKRWKRQRPGDMPLKLQPNSSCRKSLSRKVASSSFGDAASFVRLVFIMFVVSPESSPWYSSAGLMSSVGMTL